MRWLAERGPAEKKEDETSPGALYASGLIAAGGIVGLLAIGVRLLAAAKESIPSLAFLPTDWNKVGQAIGLESSALVGVLAFSALAYSLYHFRKPL